MKRLNIDRWTFDNLPSSHKSSKRFLKKKKKKWLDEVLKSYNKKKKIALKLKSSAKEIKTREKRQTHTHTQKYPNHSSAQAKHTHTVRKSKPMKKKKYWHKISDVHFSSNRCQTAWDPLLATNPYQVVIWLLKCTLNAINCSKLWQE